MIIGFVAGVTFFGISFLDLGVINQASFLLQFPSIVPVRVTRLGEAVHGIFCWLVTAFCLCTKSQGTLKCLKITND